MARTKAKTVTGFALPKKISRVTESKQVRCSAEAHDAIARIADDHLTTMTAVIDALVHMYESARKTPKKES